MNYQYAIIIIHIEVTIHVTTSVISYRIQKSHGSVNLTLNTWLSNENSEFQLGLKTKEDLRIKTSRSHFKSMLRSMLANSFGVILLIIPSTRVHLEH